MGRASVIGWIALLPLLLGAGPLKVQSAVPAPDLDLLFQRTDGWIGGDGVYSVAMTPKRTVWLFSDTWVGKVRDGRRVDATIVNNTIGVQEGANGRVAFSIARGKDGKPIAQIVPADGRSWFWLPAWPIAPGCRFSLVKLRRPTPKACSASAPSGNGLGQWQTETSRLRHGGSSK